MQNYYEILGIPTHASKKEIRQAYLNKCKEYHPDLHQGAAWAEAQLKLVNEAYETLSDTFSRNDYDVEILQVDSLPKEKIKEPVFPSIQQIKKRPTWLYGSLLALLLWIAVGILSIQQMSLYKKPLDPSVIAKKEYSLFLKFCKKHTGVISKSEFHKVLEASPEAGFTLELNRLISEGDTAAVHQKIKELE